MNQRPRPEEKRGEQMSAKCRAIDSGLGSAHGPIVPYPNVSPIRNRNDVILADVSREKTSPTKTDGQASRV